MFRFHSFVFVLLLVLFGSQLKAQPSTYPLYQVAYGPIFINPDSVRVDTTTGSPTLGHIFATGYFLVAFEYNVIHLDSVAADSVLTVNIGALDTAFHSIHSTLSYVQSKYGTITLRKKYPAVGDTSAGTCNEFLLSFNTFVDVDSALKDLKTVPFCDIYFNKPQANCVIPNDLCVRPGTHEWDIMTDANHWWRDDFHQLGWQWGWYKMHCPMAWEITEGRNTAPYVYILDGDEWNCPISDEEMSNFVQINPATSVQHISSQPLQGDHGMDCMSQAIAGINNGYPMVGVAPNCKGIGINTYDRYQDIDVGGANYGTLQATQTFADVIYVASPAPFDYDFMINHGTVVLWATGNWMQGLPGFGTAYDGELWPWTDSYYGTGGILNTTLIPATTNPAQDVPAITVGGTTDGIDDSANICPPTGGPTGHSSIERGPERFMEGWTWPEGQEKFDQTTDPTTRAGLKAAAFMDIIAPGNEMAAKPALDGCTDGYHIESGTSLSVPEVASVVGLMKSVNRWLGVKLDTTTGLPVQGSDVQTMAHTILTFTADKITDLNRPVSPMATGYPSNTSDPVYTEGGFDTRYAGQSWHYDYYTPVTDPTFTAKDVVQMSDGITRNLNRSWAQRNGFGRVNAYRAVANTIPVIGNFEYTSSTSHLGFTTGAENENGAFLMHFGAWKKMDSLTLIAGGNIIPNQTPAWPHFNQGMTEINSTDGSPTVLTVGDDPTSGDKDILAIDGIVKGDGLAANEITSTSNGKILITGYLQDVEITGATTKVDDLIIYAEDDPYSNITVSTDQTCEVYGVVQLQQQGNFIIDGGNVTIQPGGEIEMEGSYGLTIQSGSYVTMEASSTIASSSGDDANPVEVQSGATLEISGLLPASILTQLLVDDGGQVIIDAGATLQLNKFTVYPGGTITVLPGGSGLPGGRLTLNEAVYNTCLGHLHLGQAFMPSDARATLTGGVSVCGQVDQLAGIIVKGNTSSLETLALSDIQMCSTDDSDVLIKIVDAPKTAFLADYFSANRNFTPLGAPALSLPPYAASYPLVSILNTSINYAASNSYLLNAGFSACRFFDEAGPPGGSSGLIYSGIWVQNQLSFVIDESYLYDLMCGTYVMNCTKQALYEGNLFGQDSAHNYGPVYNGIYETGSTGNFCNNGITNFVRGLSGTSDLRGYLYFNTFSATEGFGEWAVTAQSGGEYDLVGNGISGWSWFGAFSYGTGNTIRLSDKNVGIGSPLLYGRNIFTCIPFGAQTSVDLSTLKEPFTNDLNHGLFDVSCGFNTLNPTASFQIAGPAGPPQYILAVDNNKLVIPGLTCDTMTIGGMKTTFIPGTICSAETATNICIDVNDMTPCTPIDMVAVTDAYPSTAAWASADSSGPDVRSYFWNASSMLLTDTMDVNTRQTKARDELMAATLIDSFQAYLPRVLNDYRTVLADTTTPPALASTVLMLKGEVNELLGNVDSAIASYTLVVSNYSSYSDSIYALWSLQYLLSAYDTTYDTSFDTSRSSYMLRVARDLLAMVDTESIGGGAGKILDGHAPDTSSLQVSVHPNPTSGTVKVCVEDLPGGIPVVVTIVNQTGSSIATLYNATPDAELGLCLQFDCSKLASGIYYADLQTEGIQQTVKFTVEH